MTIYAVPEPLREEFRRLRRWRSDADKRDWNTKLKSMRALYEDDRERQVLEEWDCHQQRKYAACGGHCMAFSARHQLTERRTIILQIRSHQCVRLLLPRPCMSVQHNGATVRRRDRGNGWRGRKLIGSSPTKTCQPDPVPTWLVKDVRSRFAV